MSFCSNAIFTYFYQLNKCVCQQNIQKYKLYLLFICIKVNYKWRYLSYFYALNNNYKCMCFVFSGTKCTRKFWHFLIPIKCNASIIYTSIIMNNFSYNTGTKMREVSNWYYNFILNYFVAGKCWTQSMA